MISSFCSVCSSGEKSPKCSLRSSTAYQPSAAVLRGGTVRTTHACQKLMALITWALGFPVLFILMVAAVNWMITVSYRCW